MPFAEHVVSLEPRRFLSVSPVAATGPVTLVPVSGIVYADTVVKNHEPDPGEGLAGCVVTFNNNADHTVSTPVTEADGTYSTVLAPGTYHLTIDGPGVKAPYDDPNFVVEGDAVTFNYGIAEMSGGGGSPQAAPDLSVSVSAPGGTIIGGGAAKSVPVKVSIANKGGAYSGPLSATVYFSTDAVIDDGDAKSPTLSIPHVSIGKKQSLKPVVVDAAAVAAGLPAGRYNVLVKITADGDANAANDTAASKSAVTLAAPVATVVPGFSGKLKASKSKQLPFTIALKNTGNTPGSGTIALSVAARPAGGGGRPRARRHRGGRVYGAPREEGRVGEGLGFRGEPAEGGVPVGGDCNRHTQQPGGGDRGGHDRGSGVRGEIAGGAREYLARTGSSGSLRPRRVTSAAWKAGRFELVARRPVATSRRRRGPLN